MRLSAHCRNVPTVGEMNNISTLITPAYEVHIFEAEPKRPPNPFDELWRDLALSLREREKAMG